MEPLKESYSREWIERLARSIKSVQSDFSEDLFLNRVFDPAWKGLELKQRMRHISQSLHHCLSGNYADQVETLKKVAPQFDGFTGMVFPDFVEVYGLDDPSVSLPALEHFTRYSSSEFAIRPFILQDPASVMKKMQEWSQHADHHVRRLSSEGCRPRLPWAMALPPFKKDPAPLWPILEKLKNDPSEYVRRSVANNLNDISRDHPEQVIDLAYKWVGKSAQTDRLVKHALRTLLKKGDVRALKLFGFDGSSDVRIRTFELHDQKIYIGESMEFTLELEWPKEKNGKIRLEYGIYYQKANGSLSRKIFQLAERSTDNSSSCRYLKKHRFQDLTTRKHYPGKHSIGIIVNGSELAIKEFDLLRR